MRIRIDWIDDDGAVRHSFGPFAPTETITLGRDAASSVCLDSRSVSRCHATLAFIDGNWMLSDEGSRFGTQVDGKVAAIPSPVSPGSAISLGRVRLRVSDPAMDDPTLSGSASSRRRYEVLLAILDLLSAEGSLDDILSAIIRLAGQAVEADRGFIILADRDSGAWLPDSVSSWLRDGEVDDFAEGAIGQMSRTVLREALDTGRTVFLKYAEQDPVYGEAESILAQNIQSVICCPLLVGERRLGAFYVDRRHADGNPFKAEDKELLETAAGQAARVLEKEQLLREKSRNEKLALLGTMLGRIAHELKNPLFNIRGTAENLSEKLTDGSLAPDEIRERLQRIIAGTDRAEANMRGLLRFARSGDEARQKVDLAKVLTAAAVDSAGQLREAGVDLQRDYEKGRVVLGSASSLEQVFTNLLVNAAQAMGETGGEIRLKMTVSSRLGGDAPDWVEVSVADTGPGIPSELTDRIFEDFFTTKQGSGGSGLGLAICRQIVEEHHGRISAGNRQDGGALIRVGLPLYVSRTE